VDIIKGSTASETKLIRAIQRAVGANDDGEIGTQTMCDIAAALGADCFPLTVEIYGAPVIIARNIVPFSPSAPLAGWNNTINGGFLSGRHPWSIMIQDGRVCREWSCHAKFNRPESVIFRRWDGSGGIMRTVSAAALGDNIRWAVGGMGLLDNYDPEAEGFCRLTADGKTEDYSDVLRRTAHTMLGFKRGYYYMVYCKSMTGKEVNAFAKKLGLEYAVMLDGGHLAAINGDEAFSKINIKERQYYAIQGEYEKY